jgi:hypothetical protein
VPNFANTLTQDAAGTWTAARMSGQIKYRADGSNGNGSPNPPFNKTIVRQSVPGGQFVPATKQGNSWTCNVDILLDYTP